MFLIQEKRKNGTNLCIVQSYRDPITKVSKTRRVLNIGYLDDLKKEYDDPIAHFKEMARLMTEEQSNGPVSVPLDLSKTLNSGDDMIKNYGYAAFSVLYHELKLDVFLRNIQRNIDINYSLNNIFKFQVYCHILFPDSIKQVYEKRNRFFSKNDFTLDDIYYACPYLYQYKNALQTWVQQHIDDNYIIDRSRCYYYLTSHYFEADKPGKNHRNDPITQLGLFVDRNGFPISYELSSKNASPLKTALKKAHHKMGFDKVIVVADSSTISSDKLHLLSSGGDGYVICQNIRDAKNEFKSYALSQDGYIKFNDDYKVKSRIYNREIKITTADGKKKTVVLKERQIVFHNETFERWAKAEREDVLMKSKYLMGSANDHEKMTIYGPSNSVRDLHYDKRTGEILQNKHPRYIDEKYLCEEEKYDGYYMLFTSEIDMDVDVIMDTYDDLWETEDAFKLKDPHFHGRPDSISRVDYMQAHFLVSFVSLLLTRLLEKKTNYRYPLPRMIRSLKKSNYVHIEDNYYALTYYDSILEHIGSSIGLDFSKKFAALNTIKLNIVSPNKK